MSAHDNQRGFLTTPLSYLRSPIHVTEGARLKESLAFFRVCTNLGIARRATLVKFARYIRFGFLSSKDAQDLILGRLSDWKLMRYALAKYWISAGFVPEEWFYFNPKALWHEEKDVVLENIIRFP